MDRGRVTQHGDTMEQQGPNKVTVTFLYGLSHPCFVVQLTAPGRLAARELLP